MKKQDKVGKIMKEYKEGTLHSGKKGPVVKSRKQAVAIALSEAKKAKPKK
jgi:ribosomal protein L21E